MVEGIQHINPKVSVWVGGHNPKKDDKLKMIDLYSVLKRCEEIEPSAEKGKVGSMFPYIADTISSKIKTSEGVLFIDFDHCSNISQCIYDNFEQLCHIMPNILAVNFSRNRNLHFFIYDEVVKNEPQHYMQRNLLFMCCLAATIRKVCNIDLRDIDGCMDKHSSHISQRLFLAFSEFKYNINCCQTVLDKNSEKRLRSEYFMWLNTNVMAPIAITVKPIIQNRENNETINVNSEFLINTRRGVVSGYEARTVIAAATYIHFNKDYSKAEEYIHQNYTNDDEICIQMRSMVNRDTIYRMYDTTTEAILFPKEKGVVLKENEYLSDKISISELLKKDKYIYICSNTGTGKTELVKKFLEQYCAKSNNDNEESNYFQSESGDSAILHKKINLEKDEQIHYIQMMKSILKGKKYGIEDFTINNTDIISKKESYNITHLTIDKLVNAFKNIRPQNTIFIVDEPHLLEDHSSFRAEIIQKLCEILLSAKAVIFLSATPKEDINILPFKRYDFVKEQQQKLTIKQIPIKLIGKGNKTSAYYSHMIEDIEKRAKERHITIFSNKAEDKWLDYGLKDKNLTRFRAEFHSEDNVLSIINDNKLDTKWCIATSYMSVGVEIKSGRHLMVIDVNEGVDIAHIIQSIGRFRPNFIDELEVLLYYKAGVMPYHPIKDTNKLILNSAWDNLLIEEDGFEVPNILSSRILNVRRLDKRKNDANNMFKQLLISHIIKANDFYSPHSYELLKQLPYKSIEVINEDEVIVSTDGKVAKASKERELITYLKSLSHSTLIGLGNNSVNGDYGFEVLWKTNKVPHNDRVQARKVIAMCKVIAKMGLPLSETLDFFNDNVKEAYKYTYYLKEYVKLQKNYKAIKIFKGAEKEQNKWNLEIDKMKEVFTKDFIQWCVDDDRVSKYAVTVDIEKDVDVISKFLDLSIEEFWQKEFIGPNVKIFKKLNINDCKKRTEHIGKKLGGKMSSPKKKVTLFNTKTKKKKTFDSKGGAMKEINVSSKSFSKIMKGGKVRGCDWVVKTDEKEKKIGGC